MIGVKQSAGDLKLLADLLLLVGNRARIMTAVGSWSRWDEARQQFDHPALVAGIRNGRIVRLLSGGSVPAVRLQEVVRELRGDFVGAYPLPGKVLVPGRLTGNK